MSTVCLHIGAMKSGSSYLQRVLTKNKRALGMSGVLFPGQRWRDQVLAAEEIVGVHPKGKPHAAGAWDSLVAEVRSHNGPSVISMETLSAADSDAAQRVVSSFPSSRVRVIVTARDLARVVPSQWQESIKNGAHLDYQRYLAVISTPGARKLPEARFFWGPQDITRILRTWQPFVAAEDLVVVTVPLTRSQPAELWQRFRTAAQISDFNADLNVNTNESLGEASAELLRLLNHRAKDDDISWQVRAVLKQIVAKKVLVNRATEEHRVEVPHDYRAWVAKAADKMVDEIDALGPAVVGSLDELRVPQWRDADKGERMGALRRRLPMGHRDHDVEDRDIMKAALDVILGLSERLAAKK